MADIHHGNFTLSESHRALRERYNDALYRLANYVDMQSGEDLGLVVDRIEELLQYYQGIIGAMCEGVELDLDSGDTLKIQLIDTPVEEDDDDYYED
jgi:hypothetical protein